MLGFHGTGADRALLAKIFDEGLVPAPRPWAHETTGIESHVFACTQPIGTRGGDPIAFAQRGAWRDRRAWLIVIDLPADADLRGAVPNEELERYWRVRSFAATAFADPDALHAVLRVARERRCHARELLRYRVKTTAEGLCAQPDAHTLVQFEAAYHRARPAQRARVARSYGLRIPDWFAEDPHYGSCMGCMWNLFEVDIVAPDVPAFAVHRGAWDRLDLTTLGGLLDATGRWLAAHGDPRVASFAALQRLAPPPDVPRAMWRDFVTADLDTRVAQPDTQLLLGHVPPAQLVGAIDLGAANRLSPLVRPASGQTLLGNLRHVTRELVAQRARARRPVVLA